MIVLHARSAQVENKNRADPAIGVSQCVPCWIELPLSLGVLGLLVFVSCSCFHRAVCCRCALAIVRRHCGRAVAGGAACH